MSEMTKEEKDKLAAKNKLSKKAEKLGILLTPEMSDEDVQTLIDAKELEIKNGGPTGPTGPEEETPKTTPKPEPKPQAVVKKPLVVQDTYGNDVPQSKYFYSEDGISDTAPDYFNKSCGYPVDREDLLEVFNRVFKKKGFLFYKDRMKEVYIVIVPLAYAKTVGKHNDSTNGDFQRHSMSFLNEGSAMPETLRMRLERVASNNFIGKDDDE